MAGGRGCRNGLALMSKCTEEALDECSSASGSWLGKLAPEPHMRNQKKGPLSALQTSLVPA